MAIETHTYVSGAWRKAKNIYVNVNGSWISMKEKWVNNYGVWRKVFSLNFDFVDTAVGTNYNLETAARNAGWDGTVPLNAQVTVVATSSKPGPGSVPGYSGTTTYGANVLGSTSSYAPAFQTGNIPSGSTILLIVPAGSYLVGKGGDGGNQANENIGFDRNGQPGGTAVYAGYPMTIINNGIIGGGGGGGAMGMRAIFTPTTDAGAGGAGYTIGMGQPTTISSSAASANGTLTTGGAKPPNNGGYGGSLGQAGGTAADAHGPYNPADPELPHPGAAGKAVELSGNVSWQVYGDVRGPLA